MNILDIARGVVIFFALVALAYGIYWIIKVLIED